MRLQARHVVPAIVETLGLLAAAMAGTAPARRIQPDELAYRGAFRLPKGSGGTDWGWSGDGLAYCPEGDPAGGDDGFPGSLFGIGHDHKQFVSEISIPAPVVSKAKKPEELPTARTLQPFADVRAGHFKDYEIYRSGLAWLPPQGRQTTPKLYFCFGDHMHEGYDGPTHGWCEADLKNPQTAGMWPVGKLQSYVTNDYMFPIPKAWADANLPGMLLATGRFREGGQGGRGPSLVAIAPWLDGNPPAPGTRLKAVPLILYTSVEAGDELILRGYEHPDEWEGGAWLTARDAAAVVFVGTKAIGKCWYGFSNGVVWPDEAPFPPIPDPPHNDRGWWATRFEGQMVFYDSADLAAVARGQKKPHEPQPYAVLRLDEWLFTIKGPQQKHHVRSCAFDPGRGHLYVMEPRADADDKPIIHVWSLEPLARRP